MKKKDALKIINPILLVLVVNQFATGLKPNLFGAGSFRLMHKRVSWLLAAGLVAHLALNFSWIKSAYATKSKPSGVRVVDHD